MDQIIPEVVGGLAEAIVGACLGFLSAYFFFQKQQTTKMVGIRGASSTLINKSIPADRNPLKIYVDRSALGDPITDNRTQIPVESAYAFSIDVVNIGNAVIEEPKIDIKLDDHAIIVAAFYRASGKQELFGFA